VTVDGTGVGGPPSAHQSWIPTCAMSMKRTDRTFWAQVLLRLGCMAYDLDTHDKANIPATVLD
jgi:hypothetical protein